MSPSLIARFFEKIHGPMTSEANPDSLGGRRSHKRWQCWVPTLKACDPSVVPNIWPNPKKSTWVSSTKNSPWFFREVIGDIRRQRRKTQRGID